MTQVKEPTRNLRKSEYNMFSMKYGFKLIILAKKGRGTLAVNYTQTYNTTIERLAN
jgi:hypothetical protein